VEATLYPAAREVIVARVSFRTRDQSPNFNVFAEAVHGRQAGD
jgi:hypothetical protein